MSNLFFTNPLEPAVLKQRKKAREDDLRGAYFRDTTAIIHSYPFRRLKHKTQVFFSPKNDHICTRIEHVMHVATVAATICRSLGLDADLAWAIGLGHDLGHTPFGHLGESIMTELMEQEGGFRHEIYSLRVVDFLVDYGKGMNLTYAVRDGILNHCGEKFEQAIRPDFTVKDLGAIGDRDHYPSTWEGAAVRMADKIAYMGRDLEDALQLDLIGPGDIPEEVVTILGSHNRDIINTLVTDLIQTSMEREVIGFSDKVYNAMLRLKEFNYHAIYRNEVLADYHRYFERILRTLFDYLTGLFARAEFDPERYRRERNFLAARFGDYACKMKRAYEEQDGGYGRIVSDYLAGMSDEYAIDCVSEIMVPTTFEYKFRDSAFQRGGSPSARS